MKSITIHGLDEKLDKLIQMKAKKNKLSLNKTIKELLEKSLGFNDDIESERRKEFSDLFGIWTTSDAKEFKLNTKDFDKIDEGDWI